MLEPSPPPTTLRFRAGRHTFQFPGPAVVMGIVNVTPDSFFDGGRYLDPQAAIDHALQLVDEGAGILDVGGESTRPHATPVPEAEELSRVLPVIEQLAGRVPVPISIDTQKPAVARAALAAGASIVNDVAAHRTSPELWADLARSGAGYICMHMQGTPATMQLAPTYTDITEELICFFQQRLDSALRAGLHPEQITLDVGIGFGKNTEHNLQLLRTLPAFRKLGRPLLLGASRKSFIAKVLSSDTVDRLAGSIACTCWAALAGVQFFRAHDVAPTVQALRLLEAINQPQPHT